MQKGFISLVLASVIVGIVVVAGVGILLWRSSLSILGGQKACTLEAKICPDGKAVGRSGPNCEFAVCPSTKPSTTASPADKTVNSTFSGASWKTYTNSKLSFQKF